MSFGCCPGLRLTGLLRNRRVLRISSAWGVLGVIAFVLWLGSPPEAWSQSIVATIPVPGLPNGLALNKVTNKIYVVGDDRPGPEPVTVIDGATDSATNIQTSCRNDGPVVVNEVTNQIYDICDDYQGNASILVIDGVTNSQTTISDPSATALAVNPATNKIYVANGASNNVTVIDGATNSTVTVTDPNASGPVAVAINPVTNMVYVLNQGTVTVIDGITNSTTTVTLTVPGAVAHSIAVNAVTNKIYVANVNNIGVIDGATNAVTTVAVPADQLAVNSTTNRIYAFTAVTGSDVIVIDGATNSTTTVPDPLLPSTVAVNETTNVIYVGNNNGNMSSVTVINGSTNSSTLIPLENGLGVTAVAVDTVTNRIYAASLLGVTVIDGNVAVPDLAGLSEGAARAALTNAALVLGTVTQKSSTTVASGNVISQSPTAGAEVTPGSGVNVVLSTGPASGGGGSSSNGGGTSSGGGGGMDWLTLGALFGLVGLAGRGAARVQPCRNSTA